MLWSGTPEPFETLDKTNKKSIFIGLAIKIAIIVVCLVLYIPAALNAVGIKPGVIIFILAIGGYAICNPFITAKRLREKTIYGLTDKRVLRAGTAEDGVPYERMKSVVLRMDQDGHTSLLCGPNTKDLKPRQWRSEADAAFINGPDDPEALRVIMYAIPNDKGLKALLKKYLQID